MLCFLSFEFNPNNNIQNFGNEKFICVNYYKLYYVCGGIFEFKKEI